MISARSVALVLSAHVALVCACLPPSEITQAPSSATCGSCHPAQLEEWRRSPHARGTRSPVFAALHDRARAAWGDAAADRCVSCHAPEHAAEDESVTCISCHGAVGNRGTHDGLLVVDPTGAPMGPHASYASGGDRVAGGTPHTVRDGALLRSSTLCATCHELSGPETFVESTGSEHASSWAASTGVECIDCHSPRVERTWANGERASGVDHSFAGIDPAWDATTDGERSSATRRATELLASALDLEVRRTADGIDVVVTNVGAGHAVPTGVAFLRDVWVDVTVAEPGASATVHARAMVIGDQSMRGASEVPLITDADHVRRGALAAGEERVARVSASGGAIVTAVLRARAARDDVVLALGLSARDTELPVLEVASASSTE